MFFCVVTRISFSNGYFYFTEKKYHLFTYEEDSVMEALHRTYIHLTPKPTDTPMMHTVISFLMCHVSLGPRAAGSYGSPMLRLSVSALTRCGQLTDPNPFFLESLTSWT